MNWIQMRDQLMKKEIFSEKTKKILKYDENYSFCDPVLLMNLRHKEAKKYAKIRTRKSTKEEAFLEAIRLVQLKEHHHLIEKRKFAAIDRKILKFKKELEENRTSLLPKKFQTNISKAKLVSLINPVKNISEVNTRLYMSSKERKCNITEERLLCVNPKNTYKIKKNVNLFSKLEGPPHIEKTVSIQNKLQSTVEGTNTSHQKGVNMNEYSSDKNLNNHISLSSVNDPSLLEGYVLDDKGNFSQVGRCINVSKDTYNQEPQERQHDINNVNNLLKPRIDHLCSIPKQMGMNKQTSIDKRSTVIHEELENSNMQEQEIYVAKNNNPNNVAGTEIDNLLSKSACAFLSNSSKKCFLKNDRLELDARETSNMKSQTVPNMEEYVKNSNLQRVSVVYLPSMLKELISNTNITVAEQNTLCSDTVEISDAHHQKFHFVEGKQNINNLLKPEIVNLPSLPDTSLPRNISTELVHCCVTSKKSNYGHTTAVVEEHKDMQNVIHSTIGHLYNKKELNHSNMEPNVTKTRKPHITFKGQSTQWIAESQVNDHTARKLHEEKILKKSWKIWCIHVHDARTKRLLANEKQCRQTKIEAFVKDLQKYNNVSDVWEESKANPKTSNSLSVCKNKNGKLRVQQRITTSGNIEDSGRDQSDISQFIKGNGRFYKHSSLYYHRYEAQQKIIAQQKIELEKQKRTIQELKFIQLKKDAETSAGKAISQLQENFSTCVMSGKQNCTLWKVPHTKTNTTHNVYQRKSRLLKIMEERAQERERRRQMLKEKREHLVKESLEIKEAEELERQKAEKREKKRLQEECKALHLLQQKKNERKLAAEERMMLKMKKANDHYNKALLHKYGLTAFMKAVEAQKEKLLLMGEYYERRILLKHFYEWHMYTNKETTKKNAVATSCYNLWLQKSFFSSLLLILDIISCKIQTASDFYELRLLEHSYCKWKAYTCQQQHIRQKKLKQCLDLHKKRLCQRILESWKKFAEIIEAEREKERRKDYWRDKVREILPDFCPAPLEETY